MMMCRPIRIIIAITCLHLCKYTYMHKVVAFCYMGMHTIEFAEENQAAANMSHHNIDGIKTASPTRW